MSRATMALPVTMMNIPRPDRCSIIIVSMSGVVKLKFVKAVRYAHHNIRYAGQTRKIRAGER